LPRVGLTTRAVCCPGRSRGALDTLPARHLYRAQIWWDRRAPSHAPVLALRLFFLSHSIH
jgi:hypothetical protein